MQKNRIPKAGAPSSFFSNKAIRLLLTIEKNKYFLSIEFVSIRDQTWEKIQKNRQFWGITHLRG